MPRRGRLGLRGESHRPAGGYLLFSPLGEVWSWGGFFRRDTWGKGLPPRQAGRCFATLSKPLSAREVVAETIDTGRAAVCWRNCGFAGKAAQPVESPAGGGPLLINTPFVPRIGNGKRKRRRKIPAPFLLALLGLGKGLSGKSRLSTAPGREEMMALAASWSRTSADLGVRGVLQLLVHGEEVLHLVEDMPGQLGDVLVIVVGWGRQRGWR